MSTIVHHDHNMEVTEALKSNIANLSLLGNLHKWVM